MSSIEIQSKTQAGTLEFQKRALARVSRTFALTIPQLPRKIRYVIGNAYLLCRIADTIEDEPHLDPDCKRKFLQQFDEVVAGSASANTFVEELSTQLSDKTAPGEKELVTNSELVVEYHRQLSHGYRDAINRCVGTMCNGMAEYAEAGSSRHHDLHHLDRYCYYVAGVVGEMLTDVFCEYSAEIKLRKEELRNLSTRFGRGLQLINILKDHHEDRSRGVNWLAHKPMSANSISSTSNVQETQATQSKIIRLLGIAQDHLDAALQYTLLIPANEPAIRRFLAWTLGFAVLTCRRMHANPAFKKGDEAKISKLQVYTTIASTSFAARSDQVLRWLFNMAAPLTRKAGASSQEE